MLSTQVSAPAKRRARSPNDVVDVKQLVAKLGEQAVRKDCVIDRPLSTHVKTRRSQGPDKEGLVEHAALLGIVLDFAPGGRPGAVALRDAWKALHRKYGIKQHAHLCLETWADRCTVKLRLALEHLIDVKSGTQVRTMHAPMAVSSRDQRPGRQAQRLCRPPQPVAE